MSPRPGTSLSLSNGQMCKTIRSNTDLLPLGGALADATMRSPKYLNR